MKQQSFLPILAVAAITVGCASPQSDVMPSPTTSEYFKTIGGGFISTGRVLKYALNFQVRKPLNGSRSWFAVVLFENPENPENPITQLNEYPSTKIDISLTSSELNSIRNHKTYKVTVKAYSDAGRTNLITTHDMFVRFDVPNQIASSFGVKIL